MKEEWTFKVNENWENGNLRASKIEKMDVLSKYIR